MIVNPKMHITNNFVVRLIILIIILLINMKKLIKILNIWIIITTLCQNIMLMI